MIRAKLDDLRKQLLDLTRRNRLLNFSGEGRRSLNLSVSDSNALYRAIALDGEVFRFANAVAEAPAGAESGRKLQTDLPEKQLASRLLHLGRETRSAQEEQGATILFLTFGIVRWEEDGVTANAPLLFVPVELTRRTVRAEFRLRRVAADISLNTCLVELCRRKLRVDLPPLPAEDELEPSSFINSVGALLSPHGWGVDPSVHLGLFSFHKFLMYRDLDPASWPHASALEEHPLVCRLLGGGAVGADTEPTGDGSERSFLVKDADGSQAAAVKAVREGRSFVLHGPPGTGKSQTITNVIADCLSLGKSVLFVSEKAAALEVVQRRLEEVGLGRFVLSLHSHRASKAGALADLKRTLEGEAPPEANAVDEVFLAEQVARLDSVAAALHTPMGRLERSPREGVLEALRFAGAPELPVAIPDVLEWNTERLDRAAERLDVLDQRLARVGDPLAHPWRDSELRVLATGERQQIESSRQRAREGLERLRETTASLAKRWGEAAPGDSAEVESLLTRTRTLLLAPQTSPEQLADDRWDAMDPRLEAWLSLGRECARQREGWRAHLDSVVELEDWSKLVDRRRWARRSPLRLASPSWWLDGRRMRSFVHAGAQLTEGELFALFEGVAAVKRCAADLAAGAEEFAPLFGDAWQGLDGDWEALSRSAEAMRRTRAHLLGQAVRGPLARDLVSPEKRASLEALGRRVEAALETVRRSFEALSAGLRLSAHRDPLLQLIADLDAELDRLDPADDALADWVDLQAARAACERPDTSVAADWVLEERGRSCRGRLAEAFRRQFHRLWLDAAFEELEPLRGFRGTDHERRVEAYRALDREFIESAGLRLANRVAARLPQLAHESAKTSKLGVLKAEMRKKRRHIPLRKLMRQSGEVVQRVKPCFMMSPISVAQYLEPGGLDFDVVIFDEASQVPPADALGAIARGRQVLLVGDERQLPPTDFFERIETDEELANSAGLDDDEGGVRASDLESILSLGIVHLEDELILRWHYRSRHPSLIEFSNDAFYDSALRVFPAADYGHPERGFQLEHVESGCYRRGKTRTNPIEADAVAQAVLRHARECPELTLGVGAFSVAQQTAIADRIEELLAGGADPAVEAFFAAHPNEPFFVKNLETIQGDERDVVLLSVGYGRDEKGRVTMNFGPLNRSGGWRRLNVLVTRSRVRCVVFASLHSTDIDPRKTSARGVLALRSLLSFLESGGVAQRGADEEREPSSLETEVSTLLAEEGWEVHTGVGASDFGVDLAVVDPSNPSRYLAGIEHDSGAYRTLSSARDRERLRPEVLAGLGWRIRRVWSVEWYQREQGAKRELLEWLAAVRDRAGSEEPGLKEHVLNPVTPPKGREREGQKAASLAERDAVAYEVCDDRPRAPRQELEDAEPERVGLLLREIVDREGPVHLERAQQILARWFDSRVSPKLTQAFQAGLEFLVGSSQVVRDGDFLMGEGGSEERFRFRGNNCPVTKAEHIPGSEYDAAVRRVVELEFGIPRTELVRSVRALMGFKRAGEQLARQIEGASARLLERGEVELDRHGHLVLSRDTGASLP